jgi:hypothetical protein
MPTTPILAEFVRFFDQIFALRFQYFNTLIGENFRIILVPVSVKLLESDPNGRNALCFCMNMRNEKRLSDAE